MNLAEDDRKYFTSYINIAGDGRKYLIKYIYLALDDHKYMYMYVFILCMKLRHANVNNVSVVTGS